MCSDFGQLCICVSECAQGTQIEEHSKDSERSVNALTTIISLVLQFTVVLTSSFPSVQFCMGIPVWTSSWFLYRNTFRNAAVLGLNCHHGYNHTQMWPPTSGKATPRQKWHWVSCFMCCSVKISTQKSSFQWVTHLKTVIFHGLCVCDSQPTWWYRNLGDCILEQALCARSYTTSLDL